MGGKEREKKKKKKKKIGSRKKNFKKINRRMMWEGPPVHWNVCASVAVNPFAKVADHCVTLFESNRENLIFSDRSGADIRL